MRPFYSTCTHAHTHAACRWKRRKGDPTTPDKYRVCSTRAWLGQIRVWRRQLHKYDPLTTSEQYFTIEDAALCGTQTMLLSM